MENGFPQYEMDLRPITENNDLSTGESADKMNCGDFYKIYGSFCKEMSEAAVRYTIQIET